MSLAPHQSNVSGMLKIRIEIAKVATFLRSPALRSVGVCIPRTLARPNNLRDTDSVLTSLSETKHTRKDQLKRGLATRAFRFDCTVSETTLHITPLLEPTIWTTTTCLTHEFTVGSNVQDDTVKHTAFLRYQNSLLLRAIPSLCAASHYHWT